MRPFIVGESLFNIIQTAVPDFVEAEYPLFVQFVTNYVRFLEQTRTLTDQPVFPQYGSAANVTRKVTTELGGPLYETRKLLEYRDADSSLDEFKTHFLNMFGKAFPNFTYVPTGELVQAFRQFYQSKGTVESIQWLFRAIFNEDAEVYFPRVDVLRASDGTWTAPLTLKVSSPLFGRPNTDVPTFYVGQRIQTSTGSAQVEAVITNVVGQAYNQNIVVNELQLKFNSVRGTFTPGQELVNIDSPGEVVTTVILPVVSSVVVNAGGSNYAVGDIVTFSQGPAGGYGFGAFGTVAIVSNTAIEGINVINGGAGFLVGQPVTFISTSGSGASAVVKEIVFGDFLQEDGTFFLLEQQTPGVTNFFNLEDTNMLSLELLIDPFVNATSNVIIGDSDYGMDSGVAQFDGVGIDSDLEIALAAVDEKPFMDPWVFTNDAETTATLANAACALDLTTNASFANGATVFSLVDLQDVTANTTTANVTANVIVAQVAAGGLSDTLFLKEFTGLNQFTTSMVLKEAGTGIAQAGTITTNGTANVVGNGTTFTAVCRPNCHLRFFDGTHAAVKQVVNNTFLITYGVVTPHLAANTWSIVPVGTVNSIIPQAQRFYGKIKAIKLLTNGAHYDTPPAVFVDSVSARAQQLFYLDPDPASPIDTTSANNAIVASADQIHVFDAADLTVQQAAGQVQQVKIINSGVNYQDPTNIMITAVHGTPRTGDDADLTAVTGALTQQPGQYTTSQGFLSADKFLQDAAFYNDYTYVIRVAESFDRYKDILLKLIHPAGFSPLGQVVSTEVASLTAVAGISDLTITANT